MLNLKDLNQAENLEPTEPENPAVGPTKPVPHAELSLIQSVPPPKPESKNSMREVAVKSGILLVIGAVGAAVYKRVLYSPILKLFSKDPPIKVPDGVIFSAVGGAISVAALDLVRRRKVKTVQKMTRRDLFVIFGGAVGAGISGIFVPRPPVETEEKPPEHAEDIPPEPSEQEQPAHEEEKSAEHGEQNPAGFAIETRSENSEDDQPRNLTPGLRREAFPLAPARTKKDFSDGNKP